MHDRKRGLQRIELELGQARPPAWVAFVDPEINITALTRSLSVRVGGIA
jgi:hypothetical protein